MGEKRKASFLVCDELLYTMNGKVNLVGIYTREIVIPADELSMSQLIFYFILEAPKDQPFRQVTFRIELPGQPSFDFETPLSIRKSAMLDDRRKTITWRHPVLIQQPLLKPGRIIANIVDETGTLDAGGIWVVTIEEAQRALSIDAS
jgi:hypothetical protein